MNSSTHSASLKKIHLFLQSLVEGHSFILFIFQSKFHFVDLFFSNSCCREWRPCAIKFGAGCTCHFYIFRCCLGFYLIMMFVCRGSAGLAGCFGEWFHTQSVGEKGNEYRCVFLWL